MAYKTTGLTLSGSLPAWYFDDLKEGEAVRVTICVQPGNKDMIQYQLWADKTILNGQEAVNFVLYNGKGGPPPPPPPPPDGN